MTPKILIATLMVAGLLCLLLAFILCSCKVAKSADEQAEKMYNEANYNARNERGNNNGNH